MGNSLLTTLLLLLGQRLQTLSPSNQAGEC